MHLLQLGLEDIGPNMGSNGASSAKEAAALMDCNTRALRIAAQKGDEAECRRLLEVASVDANSAEPADEKKYTALQLAAKAGHEGVCQLLLEKGPEAMSRSRALMLAAYHGREGVCQLLSAGKSPAELDAPFGVNKYTALHVAAMEGQEAICRLLLDKGAEVDPDDSDGRSPLHWAAYNGHLTVCRLLLERGAEVTWKDARRPRSIIRGCAQWAPALDAAAYGGHVAVCRLLLEHGAGVREGGKGALQIASHMGHGDICRLLLGHSDEWKGRAKFLAECLEEAASEEHIPVCQLLMDSGAGYVDAISAAVRAHRIEVVEALVVHKRFDPRRVPAVLCDARFLLAVMREKAETKPTSGAVQELLVQLAYAVKGLQVSEPLQATVSPLIDHKQL